VFVRSLVTEGFGLFEPRRAHDGDATGGLRRGSMVAYNDSTIEFQAWALQPRKKFVTTIETTSPRMKYAAMFAAANSTLHIIDRGFLNDPSIAQVKILNRNLHKSDEYLGVALDSHSTLLNSKRLSFSDPTINEGKDTVPDDQQIVRSPGDQCVAID
jgi:hypothetical protein